MDNILNTLYDYFNIKFKSSLKYSDTFLFPKLLSNGILSLPYTNYTGQLDSILYSNNDIMVDLKSNIKSLFDTIYENLDSVTLIFSPDSFNIHLNFFIVLPKEIYALIVAYLSSGKTVESWSKVNRHFKSLITREIEDMHTNHLWTLIKLFPNKSWDWSWISANLNITWKIIRDNPGKRWTWDYISMNPNITWDIIRDNPDEEWDWEGISRNPNITWEIIRDNPDEDWDWYEISKNPKIRWEIIRDNPDKPWNWYWISRNPNITSEPIGFLGTNFLKKVSSAGK